MAVDVVALSCPFPSPLQGTKNGKSLGEIASPPNFKIAGLGLFPACSCRQPGVPPVLSAPEGLWTFLWLWNLDLASVLHVYPHMPLPKVPLTEQTDGYMYMFV